MASGPTKVGANGRVVLPVHVRREAGLETGDRLIARNEGDHVVLESREAMIDRIQGELGGPRGEGDAVDRLIADRRREAAGEREEIARWKARRGS